MKDEGKASKHSVEVKEDINNEEVFDMVDGECSQKSNQMNHSGSQQ